MILTRVHTSPVGIHCPSSPGSTHNTATLAASWLKLPARKPLVECFNEHVLDSAPFEPAGTRLAGLHETEIAVFVQLHSCGDRLAIRRGWRYWRAGGQAPGPLNAGGLMLFSFRRNLEKRPLHQAPMPR